MTAQETPKHTTLTDALLAFQQDALALPLKREAEGQVGNQRYKYLTLDKLHDQVKPLLLKHGLLWFTRPGQDDEGRPVLAYSLSHREATETITGIFPLMLDKQTSQAAGSAITYARRYALTAVLDLVADDDDDGAAASTTPAQRYTPRQSSASRTATAKQQKLIRARAAHAQVSDAGLVAIVCRVGNATPPAAFATQDEAGEWLDRMLPDLPVGYVDGILTAIESVGGTGGEG